MEKNKNGIIALLVIIIVILLSLVILFATGTISFKEATNTNNSEEINNTTEKLTEEEAITAVKNIFTNEAVQYLLGSRATTYGQKDTTLVTEKELGLSYQWNGYYKCTNFNSYEELTNHFKTYVTADYFNSLNFNQTITLNDGTVMYMYYEKDGALYAANTGKGGNINKWKLLDETTYKIDSYDENTITATINAVWEDYSGQNKNKELEKVTLINDNGNWKLNTYESTSM